MSDVALLSEINPAGVSRFSPLRQAADWHGLVTADEVRDVQDGDLADLKTVVELLDERAKARGKRLLIRDWSHLDWIGFPFQKQPPRRCSWEDVFPNGSGACVAVVRHPVDQYFAMKGLSVLTDGWDESAVWRGLLEFAKFARMQTLWIRSEEFVMGIPSAERLLDSVCRALDLALDPQWTEKWRQFDKITGESLEGDPFQPQRRPLISREFWARQRANRDLMETLDVLEYSVPEPLRAVYRSIGRLRELKPDAIGARTTEPVTEFRVWDVDEQVITRREAFFSNPSDANVLFAFTDALVLGGLADEAIDVLRQAWNACEQELERRARLRLELEEVDELTSLTATHSSGRAGLVRILKALADAFERSEQRFDAVEPRRRLAQLAPDDVSNLFLLSNQLAGIGAIDESLGYCRHLLDRDQYHDGAAANYLLYSNYSDKFSTAEIANDHFRLGMRFTEKPDQMPKRSQGSERLRIGYLGADFFMHPVAKILLPILQAHNRERFTVLTYHTSPKNDGLTASIKQASDSFRDAHDWTDQRLLETIRDDQIDVLIELGGYTGGGNRLRMLSRRAAPVQVSFLGYPNTSALRTIDYRITDRFADPPGLVEKFYGERLLWLDHAHLAWTPYPITASIRSQCSGPPVIGSFNNVAKISPSALDAYAAILRRVPEAQLRFKYGDRFSVRMLQDRYREHFAARGVLPSRIEFLPVASKQEDHLQIMANVDLALDPFPYQGTMTSLECLAVGTPIISRCGEYYAQRATSAMLMRMELHELVAGDAAEYVEIAVQLLYNLKGLRAKRADVRERFHASALTDPAGFTKELERVLAAVA